ncbi:MAG: hypothetical protein EXS42_04130 [Lacunisphaera sp.]|nr:hypothetical protein [Lacunisphaera sp.]
MPEFVAPPPPPAEAPAQEKPAAKFSLKPKTLSPAPVPAAEPAADPSFVAAGPPMPETAAGPAPAEMAPPTLEAPPSPAVTETDRGDQGEPGEITAMRKASGMPFASPPGATLFPSFPGVPFPPPAGGKAPAPWAKKPGAAGLKKKSAS